MNGWKTALILILLAAAALRLTAALRCDTAPDYSDMAVYNRLALGEGIPLSPPPGYPLMLRLIYAFAGRDNYRAVFAVQALMGTLTVWLVFAVARRVSGTATALLAASISAVYSNFIMYMMTTLTETLALLVMMSMLLIVVSGLPEKKRSLLAAPALFTGCVVRPAFLYFWPGVLASLRKRMVFLAVTAAVTVPLITAALVTGKGTNRGALAFYKTYNPMADGESWFRLRDTEMERRDLPSIVYLREAAEFIAGNKWKTVDIVYTKTSVVFSSGWDSFVMRDLTGNSRFLNNLLAYIYLPFMLLGFFGMIRFWDGRNRLIALPVLSYLLFFILLAIFKIRYRLPAEPVLIIFSAITIGHICRFPEYRKG